MEEHVLHGQSQLHSKSCITFSVNVMQGLNLEYQQDLDFGIPFLDGDCYKILVNIFLQSYLTLNPILIIHLSLKVCKMVPRSACMR